MNPRRRSFVRKIIYLVVIFLLLYPLYWLGRPAIPDSETAKGSRGGLLAQQREENGLEQVYYGKIDPTSETLKLVTLGMRGIAADVLWIKNIEYQKKKDWTNVSATLNQITKLQPTFIDVWRHQGWNLSYNCSAEFDDYHERYRWVIKGIDFLKLGTTYNQREPRLLRDIGWFTSQKIGRSDEKKQFRRLFKEDDDFHGARPKSERDNWLVGKEWFRKTEELIDTKDVPSKGINPVVFRSQAPMCQMNFGSAMEKDGIFGERARRAWHDASKDWYDFGQYEMPTTDGRILRLGNYERLQQDRKDLLAALDKLGPGVREKLFDDRYSQLTEDQRKALDTPEPQRTGKQYELAMEAKALLRIEPIEIVRNKRFPRENRDTGKEVLRQIADIDGKLRTTKSYRGVVNYDYWDRRAKIEQMDEMLSARELVFQGGKALAEGDLDGAFNAFSRGSDQWARVLGQYPMLLSDSATEDDLEELLEQYGHALDQRNELYPPNFALAQFVRQQVEQNGKMFQIRSSMNKALEAEKAEDWATASSLYATVLQQWRQVVEDVPSLEQRADPVTVVRILATIDKYANVLRKMKQPVPANFLLHRFVRIQMEHDPMTLEAEKVLGKAEQSRNEGDLAAARKDYEQVFGLWRKILDRYPTLIGDATLGEEWIVVIDDYRELLKQQKAEMPKDFVLQDVVDRYGQP